MTLPKYLERKTQLPAILYFKENDSEQFFVCQTKEDFCYAAFYVLKERLESGYFYFDKSKEEAERIVEHNSFEDALIFIDSRADYEYEGFTFVYPVEYK